MSRDKGLLSPAEIQEGHIIKFPTPRADRDHKTRPMTIGLVHKIIYNPQDNDTVASFDVFPILPSKIVHDGNYLFHDLHPDTIGSNIGLATNNQWSVVLFPIEVRANAASLGQKNGYVNATGLLTDHIEMRAIQDKLDVIGGDEQIYLLGKQHRTGFSRPNQMTFEGYIPIIKSDNWEKKEHIDFGAAPKGKPKKHAFQGKKLLLDINLKDAVKADMLTESVAALFEHPSDPKVKPLSSLRDVWELAKGNPEELAKYVQRDFNQKSKIPLKSLVEAEKLHGTIEFGFASPRDPKKGETKAKKITDLKTAYELVMQRPQDMAKYNYLGAATQKKAIEQIPALYRELAVDPEKVAADTANLSRTIKDQWQKMGVQYQASVRGEPVEPQYLDENKQPLWTVSERTPG